MIVKAPRHLDLARSLKMLYVGEFLCRWKLVHGDVFRPPRYLELLAALIGTGVQLALLVLAVILITIAGVASSVVI